MWVTKEEKLNAKQYDLLTFLQLTDPGELVKTARGEYCTRTHDSLKISNGLWYWYSRRIGGKTAIDYLIKVKGYSFPDAVKEVNRAMMGKSPSFFIPQKKKAHFSLPEKNINNERAIEYLKGRMIDAELINTLISKGLIYESKRHRSVVFVGLDEDGNAKFASYRATGEKQVKGDFAGSDKKYSFRIENETSESVHIFEGAIDLLSYMTLCKMKNDACIKSSFISLSGIYALRHAEKVKLPPALERFLEQNKQVKSIYLHLDNDITGKNAAKEIEQVLNCKYEVYNLPPPEGKDYNDYLQMKKDKI